MCHCVDPQSHKGLMGWCAEM
ncbi:unnamed protein product, partial [Vitis vinifera]|uniref:Uncharacterized protein n=1 Tax=Vitis vinifera TaxID=29760 RepID=D7TIJ6_VITVI